MAALNAGERPLRLLVCDKDGDLVKVLSAQLTRLGHEVIGGLSTPGPLPDPAHYQADALVMDLRFGRIEGAGSVALARDTLPDLIVVLFTEDEDVSAIRRALDLGADGAVLKREGVEELERVLLVAASPLFQKLRRSASPEKVWSAGAKALAQAEWGRGLAECLTHRERELLQHLARGVDTATIATAMGLGEATVRAHLRNLFYKAGVHSRLELVASSVRAGVVRLEGVLSDS